MRTNRLPRSVKTSEIIRSLRLQVRGHFVEMRAQEAPELRFTLVRDSAPVVFLHSNPSYHGMVIPSSRRKPDGSLERFLYPTVLEAYNKHMGGVDRLDQL